MSDGSPHFEVLLLTGMSGAGRTTALKALEDLGYEAVDNLPLGLVPRLLPKDPQDADKPLALSIDTRTRDFDRHRFMALADEIRSSNASIRVVVIFLDSDDETLLRRYTETRRRHPMAEDRPIVDGIARERALVAPLREVADLVLDTSTMNVHRLKQVFVDRQNMASVKGLSVSLVSFSYRNGLPREADLVFDVRFLKNPHYEPELKELTGCDQAVRDYVKRDPDYQVFMARLTGLIETLLPRYQSEGKSYLTIAVGCTGGRHRSVTVVEELSHLLRSTSNPTFVRHREIEV